jgi:hypothetical protein
MTDTPETDAMRLTEKNGCILTIGAAQVVPADFARRLERERDEARKDAAMWKANHDNQVQIKSIISKRGDLKDRAPRVEKLIAERDQLKAINAELLDALRVICVRLSFGNPKEMTVAYIRSKAEKAITKAKEEQP